MRRPADEVMDERSRSAYLSALGVSRNTRAMGEIEPFDLEGSEQGSGLRHRALVHSVTTEHAVSHNAGLSAQATIFRDAPAPMQQVQEDKRSGKRNSKTVESRRLDARRSGIVVIHRRAFFRDCFVRCLENSYENHDVLAFETVSDWRHSKSANRHRPAVVLMFMDDDRTFNFEEIRSDAVGAPVIVISNIDNVNSVTRAFKGGARGYIPTSLPLDVAVEAVRLVAAGGTFVPESSLALDRDSSAGASRSAMLTGQQIRVVEALGHGMANKQIAHELSLSEHTVKVHLRQIMRKLNAKNRTEVAILTRTIL